MKITKEDIRKYLQSETSAEPDGFGDFTYYLHVTDDETIVNQISVADETFTSVLDPDAYNDFPDDYDWREDVEVDGNPYFETVVDDLYDQACEYFDK